MIRLNNMLSGKLHYNRQTQVLSEITAEQI